MDDVSLRGLSEARYLKRHSASCMADGLCLSDGSCRIEGYRITDESVEHKVIPRGWAYG